MFEPSVSLPDWSFPRIEPKYDTSSEGIYMHMISDAVAAATFRRLVVHLQHRQDAANIDLMGLAGFCRNCLSDWVAEAGGITKDEAREAIYGMPYATWKQGQPDATPEQLTRMAESVAKNASGD